MKKYNGEEKRRIRNKIVEEIRKREVSSILTLESPEFFFSKLLPDKKIIVWENDPKIIKKMEKKCPKNVELVFGNIGKFGVLGSPVDCVYLDFCRTWNREHPEIIRLKDIINKSKLFNLTICIRECREHKGKGKESLIFNEEDYQFIILRRLQEILGLNWKVVYGESYYDSVQMVTLILENQNAN
jgi:hypothetical protein